MSVLGKRKDTEFEKKDSEKVKRRKLNEIDEGKIEVKSKDLYRPLIFCGPSGVGKGCAVKMIMKAFPGRFGFSVSHTTRKPRGSERDGVEYHFLDKEKFEEGIKNNEFVEYAEVHSHYYGTTFSSIEKLRNEKKVCILDIDIQGTKKVYEHEKLDPVIVFLIPPSMEILEKRLRGRKTDSEEQIQIRLKNARKEMKFLEECSHMITRTVVPENFGSTLEKLKVIIKEFYNIS